MPYILKTERVVFDTDIDTIVRHTNTPGKLTYVIYKLCVGYLGKNGICYNNFATVSGALVCVGHELYRRVIAPYENKKIKQNGDV